MVKVLHKQSLADIATQHLGDANAVFDLCIVNDLSTCDEVDVATVLQLPTTTNKQVVAYFSTNKIIAASAFVDSKTTAQKGIGFWRIGLDFKVS